MPIGVGKKPEIFYPFLRNLDSCNILVGPFFPEWRALHLGAQNTVILLCKNPAIYGMPMKTSTRGTSKAGSHVSFSILLSDYLVFLHCKTRNWDCGCCCDEHWGIQRKSYWVMGLNPPSLLPFPSSHIRGSKCCFGNMSQHYTVSCSHSKFSYNKQTLDLTSLPSHILLYSASELAAEPEQCLTFV